MLKYLVPGLGCLLLRASYLEALDRLTVAKVVAEVGDGTALPALKAFAQEFARELPARADDADKLVKQLEMKPASQPATRGAVPAP
jgi:hypothetical protein